MYLSNHYAKDYSQYFVLIALLFGIAQFYLYITDSRKTGIEVFGADIWWNQLRPVHGMLYLLFCVYIYKKQNHAYIPLLIDIVIAIIAFVLYHNNELRLY